MKVILNSTQFKFKLKLKLELSLAISDPNHTPSFTLKQFSNYFTKEPEHRSLRDCDAERIAEPVL